MTQALPLYQCHKLVRAAKIVAIMKGADDGWASKLQLKTHAGDVTDVEVPASFLLKHRPEVGGYYVVYEGDGYASFSPAKAFEDGYAPFPG